MWGMLQLCFSLPKRAHEIRSSEVSALQAKVRLPETAYSRRWTGGVGGIGNALPYSAATAREPVLEIRGVAYAPAGDISRA